MTALHSWLSFITDKVDYSLVWYQIKEIVPCSGANIWTRHDHVVTMPGLTNQEKNIGADFPWLCSKMVPCFEPGQEFQQLLKFNTLTCPLWEKIGIWNNLSCSILILSNFILSPIFICEYLRLISVWQDDIQVLGNDANEIQEFYKKYCASMSQISEKRNL